MFYVLGYIPCVHPLFCNVDWKPIFWESDWLLDTGILFFYSEHCLIDRFSDFSFDLFTFIVEQTKFIQQSRVSHCLFTTIYMVKKIVFKAQQLYLNPWFELGKYEPLKLPFLGWRISESDEHILLDSWDIHCQEIWTCHGILCTFIQCL